MTQCRAACFLRACLAFALLAGSACQPGNSTAMQKVFCIPPVIFDVPKILILGLDWQETLLVQAVWQQAVGVPQCQMRFGSNEKVTVIMAAGVLSSCTISRLSEVK